MRETIPEDLKAAYELTDPDRFVTYSYPASHTHKLIERIAKAEARNKVLEEALRELVDSSVEEFGPSRYNTAMNVARAALREDR